MTEQQCSQEPRLAKLEAALSGIGETLKDVRELLASSIRASEQIIAIRDSQALAHAKADTLERRVGKLETTQAARGWIDRVAWAVVAAGLALVLKG